MKYSGLLRHRDFVLLTGGTTVSTLGGQVGWLAILWLVMVAMKSPARMGLAALCAGLPSVIAGLFVGGLLDRFPRKRLMVLDNLLEGLVFITIAVLYWAHLLTIGLLCGLLAFAGMLSPMTMVGASTLFPELVPPDVLSLANAWDEMLWQGASLVAPLLSGVLIATAGAPVSICVNGLFAWMCAACFGLMRQGGKAARPVGGRLDPVIMKDVSRLGDGRMTNDDKRSRRRWSRQLTEGIRALLSLRLVFFITLVALLLNLAYGLLDVAMPLFIHRQLHHGGDVLGLTWTGYGLGALLGTMVISVAVRNSRRKAIWMCAMVIAMGASLIPLIVTHAVWIILALMTSAGFFFGPYAPMSRTIVQERVPEEMRGRIFGLRTAIIGVGGLSGSALGGLLLELTKPSLGIGMTGIAIVAIGAVALCSRNFRSA